MNQMHHLVHGRQVLFDAYLVVDWSAASRPKQGNDSIWYCRVEHGKTPLLVNLWTRNEAALEIEKLLLQDVDAGRSVLVGFDFPYGYPRGLHAALGLASAGSVAPWRAVWQEWSRLVQDGPDNANNRFSVAAELNKRLSGAAGPFWGCPPGEVGPYLARTKPRESGLPERRLVEEREKRTQPAWKLAYPGSVGSQALLGIPRLEYLLTRSGLAPVSRVWPFEWSAQVKEAFVHRELLVLHAEVFPSLFRVRPGPGEIKDAVQVRHLATFLAQKDLAGELSRLLDVPLGLPRDFQRAVVEEEGWILGVE